MRDRAALVIAVLCVAALARAGEICSMCKCKNSHVDCRGLGLEVHFNETDWSNATRAATTRAWFDNNKFVHVTRFPPVGLVFLSLSHNDIVRIDEEAFINLDNLTELDLSHNELTSENLTPDVFKGHFLPDEYQPIHKLRVLRLGNNALHSLKANLFEHLPNLKILSLDSNPLQVIDLPTMQALNSLPDLEFLDLAYTELVQVPQYLLHAPRFLKLLNLTGNLLTSVPDALAHSHALEELYLSENPISVISKKQGVSGLKDLRVLHLSYMSNLTSVEARSMSQLPALQELILNNNPLLEFIDPYALSWRQPSLEVEQWPQLKKLDLSHNQLESLDRHLLGRWDTLEYLNLEGNSWMCDCENQWMVTSLLPSMRKLLEYQMNDLRCSQPEEMVNRRLLDLQLQHYHMRCLDKDGNHPEKDAKMLVGVLIGVLIAIPLTMAAVILVRRTGIAATLFNRSGGHEYSKAFYSRADSVEHF